MSSEDEERGYRPLPAAPLRSLAAYAVPRAPVPIDLYLDGNEGLAPAPELLEALSEAGTEALRRYPDARPLEASLAALHGVAPERVLVTAGADEALDRLFRALTWEGREAVVPWPSFVMIPHYARLAGATVRHVAWTRDPFPLEDCLRATGDATALVLCVTPNNPTGLVATAADLEALSARAPGALVVLDHAYAEFADADLTERALALPNVLVLRTFSKARGLAGLRVGYALGPAEVIRLLRAAGGPYPVSSASLVLAAAALERHDPREEAFRRRVRLEREELAALARALGGEALHSQGNFVLPRFRDAAWVRDALAGLGISVRIFPGDASLAGALRITCPGEPAAFERLEHALRSALAPEALVLDVDLLEDGAAGGSLDAGALADLSGLLPVVPLARGPRAAAERALARAGAEALTGALLVAERELPVEALRARGIRRAWLVGGSEETIRRARAAGLVPLALGTEAAGPGADRLHAAGAARILPDLAALRALLEHVAVPAPSTPGSPTSRPA